MTDCTIIIELKAKYGLFPFYKTFIRKSQVIDQNQCSKLNK